MRLQRWVRSAHKWISLAVGLQALLWMAGGLYMVAVPIGVVHGNQLARTERLPLQAAATRLTSSELLARYPGATGFRLKRLGKQEVYEVAQGKTLLLLDAASGARLGPLGREAIGELAARAYTGSGSIERIDWLTTTPQETGGRPAPLWAVHFGDLPRTTLYYSPDTGELLARRHALWRWFDLFWMLHIMDYAAREDVNNPLLRGASIAGMGAALSGLWLLVYWLRKRSR
jgi:hypothetical protein